MKRFQWQTKRRSLVLRQGEKKRFPPWKNETRKRIIPINVFSVSLFFFSRGLLTHRALSPLLLLLFSCEHITFIPFRFPLKRVY